MGNTLQQIEDTVVSRPPGAAYGNMYRMHRYWSKKSPDVISAYIERYTRPGDIVLDPFCGSGITLCEAVRLGRKAVGIDINPMATFITGVTLSPISLSQLKWAFEDVKRGCEERVNELYVTHCPRCGEHGTVDFVVRSKNDAEQIAYTCACSPTRQFKDPDKYDEAMERSLARRRVPHWFPRDIRLPVIQKERFKYLSELFTKRNLIALSVILNTIEHTGCLAVRNALKMAFTGCLANCSRLKPIAKTSNGNPPSLKEGWVAVRFYAPNRWQEVNPWLVFERSFDRVLKGKRESNAKLPKVSIGSSFEDLLSDDANVLIVQGSAEDVLTHQIPRNSIDYVLTDPPFGSSIQYLSLSTFWGAWLKHRFDYENEIVVDRHRGKSIDDYECRLEGVFRNVRRVTKIGSFAHIFCHDVRGPYLHSMLRLMMKARILPERVVPQPPPSSFSAARNGKGHFDSYIIRGRSAVHKDLKGAAAPEQALKLKIAETVSDTLRLRRGSAPVPTMYHAIYRNLKREDLLSFCKKDANEMIENCIKDFAIIRGIEVVRRSGSSKTGLNRGTSLTLKKALLDAKSLYVNNPRRDDRKSQVYQRVLCKFQNTGLTVDDVREVDQGIEKCEVRAHRKKRMQRLLRQFGVALGFDSHMTRKGASEVSWEVRNELKITFRVMDKNVVVNARRSTPKAPLASEVGSIRDEHVERAMLDWCQENPGAGRELAHLLSPVEYSNAETMQPTSMYFKVLTNEQVCPSHFLIRLKAPCNLPGKQTFDPLPGQFLHLICDPQGRVTRGDPRKRIEPPLTLRRPFSIHRVFYSDFDRRLLASPTMMPIELKRVIRRPVEECDILYKVVGRGTKILSGVRPGQYIDAIGPIGNGFRTRGVRAAIIAAGGIGVAPLVLLAERLRYLGSKVYLYLGALREELLKPLVHRADSIGALREELLKPLVHRADSIIDMGFSDGTPEFLDVVKSVFLGIGAESVVVTTDDGSLGRKGLLSDVLEDDITSGVLPLEGATVFSCGPPRMLEAISGIAAKYNIPCQVLLEERMACGIGACLSCTCHIRSQSGKVERKRVCVDGPVFDAESVVWKD